MTSRRAIPRRQQREPLFEPGGDLGRRRGCAGGRRPARWPAAIRRGGGRSRRSPRDRAPSARTQGLPPCPLDEEVHSGTVGAVEGQDGNGAHVLAGHPQPFATGRRDAHAGATRQEALDQFGDRVEDVLAVVDQQHELGLAHDLDDPIDRRDAGPPIDAQRGSDHLRGRRGVGRREIAPHHGSVRSRRVRRTDPSRRAAGSCRHLRARRASTAARRRPGQPTRRRASSRPISDDSGTGTLLLRAQVAAGGAGEQFSVLGGQRRRRFDAQLLAQQPAEVVVDAQRLGDSTRICQRRHQQGSRPFPAAVRLSTRSVRSATRSSLLPLCQARFGSPFARPDPKVFEATRFRAAIVGVLQFGEGGPGPPRQDRVECSRRVWLDVGWLREQRRQPIRIDDHCRRVEAISVGHRVDRSPAGHDAIATADSAAQPPDPTEDRPATTPRPQSPPRRLDRAAAPVGRAGVVAELRSG